MRLIKKIAPVILALAMCAGVLGFVAPSASARTEIEMTPEQAGQEYLSFACSSNEATGVYYKRVYRGRSTFGLSEARRRLPKLRRHSMALSRAAANASRDLRNPPEAWPSTVESDMRSMAIAYVRMSDFFSRAGNAGNAMQWMLNHHRGDDAFTAATRTARKVRPKLDLPPPGEGC